MKRAATVLGAVVCVLVALASVAMLGRSQPAAAMMFFGGIAGLVMIQRWGAKRERTDAAASRAADEAKLVELERDVAAGAGELRVESSSPIVATAFAAALAAVLVWLGVREGDIVVLVIGVFLIAFVVLIGLTLAASIGRPALVLSPAGLQTPHAPVLPWDAIDGMYLRENAHRGSTISHTIVLSVPDVERFRSRFGLGYRVVHMLSGRARTRQFHVVLRKTNVSAHVVYRLARALWTRHTGRNHEWDPEASPEANAARRRAAELESTPASAAVHGRDAEWLAQMNVVSADLKRQIKRRVAFILAIVGIAIAYGLYRVFR